MRLDVECLWGTRRRKEPCRRLPRRLPARIEAVPCCWSCVYFVRSNLYHDPAPLPMLRLVWLQHRPRTGTRPTRRLSQMPGRNTCQGACLALSYGRRVQHAVYGVWQLNSSHRASRDETRRDKTRRVITRMLSTSQKRLDSAKPARRLDQRSPARVSAIGIISGVTWTHPKERIELVGCQGHSWLLSRGVLESNRFILACELHAIPPLLHPYQPPYFAPVELQKIQAGRTPSTTE